jgi:hypothetical protein
MAGKVKVTESLINVVTSVELKKLTSSGQNGDASVSPLSNWRYTDTGCTAERRDLTQQNVTKRNEINPTLRHGQPRQAGPQGGLMAQRVRDGTKSESGSVTEPIETLVSRRKPAHLSLVTIARSLAEPSPRGASK